MSLLSLDVLLQFHAQYSSTINRERLVTRSGDGYFKRMSELHYFDPLAEFTIIERKLPHWSQAGVVSFITWRTQDSIPADVLERWRHERQQWLRQHGINPRAHDWRQQLQKLEPKTQREFFQHFSTRWHEELDACHGACVLRRPDLAQIVADGLRKFETGLGQLSVVEPILAAPEISIRRHASAVRMQTARQALGPCLSAIIQQTVDQQHQMDRLMPGHLLATAIADIEQTPENVEDLLEAL